MRSGYVEAYSSAAVEGCTRIGLFIAAYGALAAHLQRAADAVGRGSIEDRCANSSKALILLAHLDSWSVDLEEAPLIGSLARFHNDVRDRVVAMQVSKDPGDLERIVASVLEVRGTWQLKEQRLQEDLRMALVESPATKGRGSSLAWVV